jgi:hypothetical protein
VRIHPQMKRGVPVLLASAVVLAAAVFVASASSFDRTPITLTNVTPDQWGQTVTGAERLLGERFPGIKHSYCVGAVLAGYQNDESFWLDAGTRYWDKLVCTGTLRKRPGSFALVFDPKGQATWTIYRLKGASVRELYGKVYDG